MPFPTFHKSARGLTAGRVSCWGSLRSGAIYISRGQLNISEEGAREAVTTLSVPSSAASVLLCLQTCTLGWEKQKFFSHWNQPRQGQLCDSALGVRRGPWETGSSHVQLLILPFSHCMTLSQVCSASASATFSVKQGSVPFALH